MIAMVELSTTMQQHIVEHPEIGAVLDAQHGAQSGAYDIPELRREHAPMWLQDLLEYNDWQASVGLPFLSAELASDGWWWRVAWRGWLPAIRETAIPGFDPARWD